MQAHKKISPNKEGFSRELPGLLQGFTREKIDIILRLGCEKPCESLNYLGGIPYLNTLTRTIPYLNTLTRTIPYPNTLNRTIPYLNTLSRIHSGSSANQNRVISHPSRQPIRIEYYITRHPIKFEYYVTRVVSQSELCITSPESSRLGLKTLLGSRLDSARYSLS